MKMGLQEIGWRGMYWTDLAHNRDRLQVLLNAVVDCQVL
jgi:hypothetical protein